ncbi:MAG: SH3 domain-containing protein [Leptolyngbya sp. SIO1D8]|nr:SH3 domain-containing protein [Leptolyngbya sp. SIO1D8]
MTLSSSAITGWCALVLVLGAAGCRGGQEATQPEAPAETSDTAIPGSTPDAETPITLKSFESDSSGLSSEPFLSTDTRETSKATTGTSINPPQSANLTAQQADAQINLRSQPTTQSNEKGYGLVGDSVELLRSAEGDSGYTWYYVAFKESEAEGWIRGDFIDTEEPVAAATSAAAETEDALGEALDAICGGPENLSAYYSTQNYNIYICKSPNGLIYVGNEKGTSNTLVSQSVSTTETGFLARSSDYTYTIDASALEISQGSKAEPLLQEAVDFSERY